MATRSLNAAELNHLLSLQPETSLAHENMLDASFLDLLLSLGRQNLSLIMQEETYFPGDLVFQEGEAGDALYLLWAGRVAIVKGEFPNPVLLRFHGPGEVIGEMALLENRPRSASVVALENLRLLRIGRDDFYRLLHEIPTMSLKIMENLSTRLRMADQARSRSQVSEKRLSQQVHELISERKQLLELQRLRQETLDMIVHDLRNPLGSISMSAKMLEMVLPEDCIETNRQVLNVMQNSCDRLLRMVDTMLEVARIDAEGVHLSFISVDVNDLIQRVVNRLSPLCCQHVEMILALPPLLPLIQADMDVLDRVVTNLLDNAIKHSPQGAPVRVTVDVEEDALRITISDQGPGIPPEDRERVFERFAQTVGEKRRRRGFGLGLAFCRLAIEAHGGRIWAEAGDGEVGSKFVFTLPLGD